MNASIRCAHCDRTFSPDPRVKNQQYCPEKACQPARKRKWQKEKLATDPDYKANQHACQIAWHARHPGYYQEYRRNHSAYRERNKLLQRCRSAGTRMIAKMDASAGRILLLPIRYEHKTGDCKRGLDSFVQQGALLSLS